MDFNGDKRKDLILGERDGYIRVYLNEGTDRAPVFNSFTYLQVGGKTFADLTAKPQVVDWNGDKKPDLVVGVDDGRVRLLLNTGTKTQPKFKTAVYLKDGASDLSVSGKASPFAADLDGDGKKDLIVGDMYGGVYFYRNVGTNAVPRFNGSVALQAGGTDINVGYYARPVVVDWDGDGKLDIICGNYDYNTNQGNVWLFRGL